MAAFEANDPEAGDKMRKMFGPSHVDQQIRQAIHFCWMMLPEDKRTIDELEKQLRRIVERAIKDFKKDAEAFGLRARRRSTIKNTFPVVRRKGKNGTKKPEGGK